MEFIKGRSQGDVIMAAYLVSRRGNYKILNLVIKE